MAVTANQLVRMGFGGTAATPTALGVLNGIRIYSGTLTYVDVTTGFLTDTSNAGANAYFGVAQDEYDNTGGANGDIVAEVYGSGKFILTGSGFAQDDVGVPIHGVDNYVIQLSTTGASVIGTVVGFVSATELQVETSNVRITPV